MPILEVFQAFENGELRQIGLSAEQIRQLCPESILEGWTVTSDMHEVGEANGTVMLWPSGREHVHWMCPDCQLEHISDFFPYTISNPVLWFCESGNRAMFLVHWKHEESICRST